MATKQKEIPNATKNYFDRLAEDVQGETGKAQIFEEVLVSREGREFRKLEVRRKRVLISPFQAAVLNEGRRECLTNRIFTLYLMPGTEKIDPLPKPEKQ